MIILTRQFRKAKLNGLKRFFTELTSLTFVCEEIKRKKRRRNYGVLILLNYLQQEYGMWYTETLVEWYRSTHTFFHVARSVRMQEQKCSRPITNVTMIIRWKR